MPVVIAVSGRIGAGKGALASALAGRIGADLADLGAEVARAAVGMGFDARDPEVLQRVGQRLVTSACPGLVGRALSRCGDATTGRPLVVTGLRHVEVLLELRRLLGPGVRVVHLDTPDAVCEARVCERHGIAPRRFAVLASHVSEEQCGRILPQYASRVVSGTLPVELQVAMTMTFLHLRHPDHRVRAA